MLTQAEVLQKYYGVQTFKEALDLQVDEYPEPWQAQTTTLQLPYEAPNHPGIPSLEDIDKAMEQGNLSQLRRTCRIGPVVVKSARHWTIIQEAEDLLFLKQHSEVRVPDLYAAFSRQVEGEIGIRHYMVIEHIEGESLTSELWLSLSAHGQKKLASSLAKQLRLLRSIPPPTYYGRVHNQGWDPLLNLFRTRCEHVSGPYNTYQEFKKAVIAAAEINAAQSFRPWGKIPELLPLLSELETKLETWENSPCSRPTFTHVDPGTHNMIFRRVQNSNQDLDDDDWEAVLIDWSNSGWYPAWMQAATFNAVFMIGSSTGPIIDWEAYPKECEKFLNMVFECDEESYDEQVELFQRLHDTISFNLH